MECELRDLRAGSDPYRQLGHSDTAIDIERRTMDVEKAFHVSLGRPVEEPGPVEEGQIHLAAVRVPSQN